MSSRKTEIGQKMHWITLLCAVFPLWVFADSFNLCHLDLVGNSDHVSFEDRLNEMNDTSDSEITVHLHVHTPDKTIRIDNSFEKWIDDMVSRDFKCDGLMMSGEFDGGRFHQIGGDTEGGKNKLDLAFLERVSCSPKYKSWFENVKQLWLVGSYTVTDRVVKQENIHKMGDIITALLSNDADFFNIKKINLSSARATDRGAPISSRWLRAFPNANLYGFEGDVIVSSRDNIAYDTVYRHIKEIGQADKSHGAETKSADWPAQTISNVIGLLARGGYYGTSWKNIVANGLGAGTRASDYGKTRELGCKLANYNYMMMFLMKKNNPGVLGTFIWCEDVFEEKTGRRECKGAGLLANSIIRDSCSSLYFGVARKQCLDDAEYFVNRGGLRTIGEIVRLDGELEDARSVFEDNDVGPTRRTWNRQVTKAIVGNAYVADDSITVAHLLLGEIDRYILTTRDADDGGAVFRDAIGGIRDVISSSSIVDAIKEKMEFRALSTIRKLDYLELYKFLYPDMNSFVVDEVQYIIDNELKCAYWKKKNDGTCDDDRIVGRNSHMDSGDVTRQFHYTFTAVVSDVLKQYDLLTMKQSEMVRDILRSVPDDVGSDFIEAVAACMMEEEDYYNCKEVRM